MLHHETFSGQPKACVFHLSSIARLIVPSCFHYRIDSSVNLLTEDLLPCHDACPHLPIEQTLAESPTNGKSGITAPLDMRACTSIC